MPKRLRTEICELAAGRGGVAEISRLLEQKPTPTVVLYGPATQWAPHRFLGELACPSPNAPAHTCSSTLASFVQANYFLELMISFLSTGLTADHAKPRRYVRRAA